MWVEQKRNEKLKEKLLKFDKLLSHYLYKNSLSCFFQQMVEVRQDLEPTASIYVASLRIMIKPHSILLSVGQETVSVAVRSWIMNKMVCYRQPTLLMSLCHSCLVKWNFLVNNIASTEGVNNKDIVGGGGSAFFKHVLQSNKIL